METITMRDLMDTWDEAADQAAKDQIKSLLDGGDLIFFFKKGDDLFGSTESSRVVYATMLNPDEETPKNFVKDANFSAVDLHKALEGFTVRKMFDHKDLKKIKVMDSDDVYKLLVKKADHNAKINLTKVIKDMPQDDDEDDTPQPDNMDKLGEK